MALTDVTSVLAHRCHMRISITSCVRPSSVSCMMRCHEYMRYKVLGHGALMPGAWHVHDFKSFIWLWQCDNYMHMKYLRQAQSQISQHQQRTERSRTRTWPSEWRQSE